MKHAWSITAIGVLAGAAAGWAYWFFFGCTSGCAITSSPVNSTLYGAVMGGLVVHSFKRSPASSSTNNK